MTLREDIPLGFKYDERGNVLTYKDNSGYWSEYTYDERGNVLTSKDSYGDWHERTYDALGYELSYKDSDGDWHRYTRDTHGNELTFKDSSGYWQVIASSVYNLRFLNGVYWAGCRRFTRGEALAHWGSKLNHERAGIRTRAKSFIEAINNHESNDSPTKE